MKAWLSLLALLLAACASEPKWTHPTKDSYEWKADASDCERFHGGSEQDQLACMREKGWRRSK